MQTQMDKKKSPPLSSGEVMAHDKNAHLLNIAKQMLNYSMVSHTVYPGLLKITITTKKKTLHYGLEFRGKNKK